MVEKDSGAEGQGRRRSRLAQWSFIFAVVSIFTAFITAVPALVLGVILSN